jgi:tripeptide aminopeptidase
MKTALADHDNALGLVRRLPAAMENFREMLLANLVMIGEIPAPTFGESQRIEFLKQRFDECGLFSCSTDEVGNGVGILPGVGGPPRPSILVWAHADTPFSENINHSLCIQPDRVIGPGVADNSLGLAVLATLPTLLERLEIRLQSDLVLMGASRTLGRGNLEGLRFFLANNKLPLTAAVSVEGVYFGRLNYASLASLDGEIVCRVQKQDVPNNHSQGAIIILSGVIDRLRTMSVPSDEEVMTMAAPETTLILGSVEGGTSFKQPAREALLRFQVLSESDEALARVERRIRNIVEQVSSEMGATISFEVIARTNFGGLDREHPVVLQTRRIIAALGTQPLTERYSSSVSSFVEQGIPAVTVGITTGQNLNEPDEEVAIEPMLKGVAQLVGTLLAIDGGCCDRH